MKYATRLNSFLQRKGQTMETALEELGKIEGITSIDVNYPEHFSRTTVAQMQALVKKNGLEVNSVALRSPGILKNGEFCNRSMELAKKAEDLCIEAIQVCRELGGKIVTIWQAFDGFDYSFQVDYAEAWQVMINAFRRIADAAAPDIRISIEYKPYQPRSFSLVPNIATAMLLISEIGRDNIGLTLDFCHMLMAGENPAASLAMAASHKRLLGVHLNDGYRLNDDGLMIGSVHPLQTLEFLYYAKKYGYSQAIYFDTFPIREDPAAECRQNLETTERFLKAIDEIGLDKIGRMIAAQDGMSSMEILHMIMK